MTDFASSASHTFLVNDKSELYSNVISTNWLTVSNVLLIIYVIIRVQSLLLHFRRYILTLVTVGC